jgi:hypothetical protein
MDAPEKRRWYRPTPGWLVLGSLAVTGLLWLSNWLGWWHKGYAVLVAVAGVGVVLLAMLLWWLVAVVFRRRFQFGIRTLLALVVVVALPCSWLAIEVKGAKAQAAAVAAIKAAGGSATYDFETDESNGLLRNSEAKWPSWVRNILENDLCSSVDGVGLCRTRVTGKWLENLSDLREIRALNLAGTQISDADLEGLRHWPKIRNLFLDYDDISDRGLERVQALHQLQVLSLNGTRITDDALKYVANLRRLRHLNLPFTGITDNGLKHLEGSTQLTELRLTGTKVTAEGVRELQQALPNCKVDR